MYKIAFAAILAFALMGCKKEEPDCKICATTVQTEQNGVLIGKYIREIHEYCDPYLDTIATGTVGTKFFPSNVIEYTIVNCE